MSRQHSCNRFPLFRLEISSYVLLFLARPCDDWTRRRLCWLPRRGPLSSKTPRTQVASKPILDSWPRLHPGAKMHARPGTGTTNASFWNLLSLRLTPFASSALAFNPKTLRYDVSQGLLQGLSKVASGGAKAWRGHGSEAADFPHHQNKNKRVRPWSSC